MKKYPRHVIRLIDTLKTLPGVGQKTAERYAFHLIGLSPNKLKEIASIIGSTPEEVRHCSNCGCLKDELSCTLCDPEKRDPKSLCIVATAKDALTIEQTHQFHGMYHVLGGLLSPIEGRGPESIGVSKLLERIALLQTEEVIVALDSTLEGDATSLYIAEQLRPLPAKVSRLALGLPMGSSLDFVDGGTLAHALSARSLFR